MTQTMSVHGPTGIADLLERALLLVDDGTYEQGRLLAEFGLWASHERADYAASLDAFERALAIANSLQDPFLELRVHSNATPVHDFNLQPDARLESGLKAIRLAGELDDPVSVDAHFHVGFEYLERGDVASARFHAEMAVPLAERTKNVFHWTSAMSLNAGVSSVTGDWDSAREFIIKGLERSPTEFRMLGHLLHIELMVGNFDRAIELVPILEGAAHRSLGALALGALFSAPFTITDKFIEANRQAIQSDSIEPLTKHYGLIGLGMVAIARQDSALASEVYGNPNFDQTGGGGGFDGLWLVPVVASLAGLRDEAIARFEAQNVFLRDAGFKPSLALSLAFNAEMLLENEAHSEGASRASARAGSGEREKAIELQDEALAITRELGMRPLTERVVARREILRA